MWWKVSLALWLAAPGALIAAQTIHLSAVEGSLPVPVVERTASGLNSGLASLWADPTSSPHAVGGFFGAYTGSYSSVRVYHTILAFRLGPRWSAAFGASEVGSLFDTSLTNQDPALENLRVRAYWAGLDATVGFPLVRASVGVALAGDENLGDVQTSTVARVHVRVNPFPSRDISLGVHYSGAMGGSLPVERGGQRKVDVVASRALGTMRVGFSVAIADGRLWRFSETKRGYGAALKLTIASHLDLALGVGRYSTTFGSTSWEWHRSVGAGVCIAPFTISVRYTTTGLGIGSGSGVALGYRPRPHSCA